MTERKAYLQKDYEDVKYRWLTKDSGIGKSNIYKTILLDLSIPSLTGHVYNKEALNEAIENAGTIPLKSSMDDDVHAFHMGLVTNVKISDDGFVVGEVQFLTTEGFMHQELLELGEKFFPALGSLVSYDNDLKEVIVKDIISVTLLPLT